MPRISTSKKVIDAILNRGIIVNILPSAKDFKKKLLSGNKLKIYIGVDPTSDTLHLSHAKNFMLLEEFRQLGHEVYVLFGDFTARIGDPTDRTVARKQLSKNEVRKNVKGWLEQIRPLMNFKAATNPPRIVYNSTWLSKLTLENVVELASNFTVQKMVERDMFQKRLKEEKPIYIHEFMYPLLQGYDSVALNIDVEICGTDQTFNALVGRTLLKRYSGKEKHIVVVNLMENPKTGELMSKSKGTGVFLNTKPLDMYGSVMAQPDEMIKVLLVNNLRVPLSKIEKVFKFSNPRDAKMVAAFETAKIFHGEKKAREAEEMFKKTIVKKEIPEDIKVQEVRAGSALVTDLLVSSGLAPSKSEARRLIEQKGIRINGNVVKNIYEVATIPSRGIILQKGKRHFIKIVKK